MASDYPFVYDSTLENITTTLINNTKTKQDVAKRIYDWTKNNITYDQELSEKVDFYFQNKEVYKDGCIILRDSLEVFYQQKAICSEQAFLMITIADLAGINADFVHIKKDYEGKQVNHACVGFEIDGTYLLADPVYRQFNIKHQDYEVWSTDQLVKIFQKTNNIQKNKEKTKQKIGTAKPKKKIEPRQSFNFKEILLPLTLTAGILVCLGLAKLFDQQHNSQKKNNARIEYLLNK